MTELERALDELFSTKGSQNKRQSAMANKLKKQLRKQKKSCSRSKRGQVNSAAHSNTAKNLYKDKHVRHIGYT